MSYGIRTAFYVLMLLLVGAVIVGVYYDRPLEDTTAAVAPAATDENTDAAQPTDAPVTDATPESVNHA